MRAYDYSLTDDLGLPQRVVVFVGPAGATATDGVTGRLLVSLCGPSYVCAAILRLAFRPGADALIEQIGRRVAVGLHYRWNVDLDFTCWGREDDA